MQAGQTIAYSRRFLKSIGGDYDTAQRRGRFLGYPEPWAGAKAQEYAMVQWDDMLEPSTVRSDNICGLTSVAFVD